MSSPIRPTENLPLPDAHACNMDFCRPPDAPTFTLAGCRALCDVAKGIVCGSHLIHRYFLCPGLIRFSKWPNIINNHVLSEMRPEWLVLTLLFISDVYPLSL